MGAMVEKIEADGSVSVLHDNIPGSTARDIARAVIAGNPVGSVQVRITPLEWSDENAEYWLNPDAAIVIPPDPEPVAEVEVEAAPEPKKKSK